MSNLNKFMGIGRLTKQPELKTVNGNNVCEFSIAINDTWKDKDGNKTERTEFVNIVVWGSQANACNDWLNKGSSVFVEGKLQTDKYTDKTGVVKYFTKIRASVVQFLDSSNEDKKRNTEKKYERQNDADFTSDDIPF